MTDIGYGIRLYNETLTDTAFYHIQTLLQTEKISNNMDTPFDEEKDDIKSFCNNYETFRYITRKTGIPALLTDILNAVTEGHQFQYQNGCIYVPACFPKNRRERDEILTREEIDMLMKTYVLPVYKKHYTCEILEIHID